MDILCFSHLRWDFVYQRPQHLMSRLARQGRVFYIEEPMFNAAADTLEVNTSVEQVIVVKPHLEKGPEETDTTDRQRTMLKVLLEKQDLSLYISWFYTPMALPLARCFHPKLIVYDCMDELSAFKFAPPALKILEKELLAAADLVFTGGHSLYEAKKNQHKNVYSFPSSIDKAHFNKARERQQNPSDQAVIPYPRLGFYGVLDERFDIDLIRFVAEAKPEWQLVLIGPVVKIDPASLPQLPNIHYLGPKSYNELPAYLSGWNLAMITFALNESTRYISPTKTPEYLAAGKPVVSTAIADVVNSYGNKGLVHIAHTPEEFVEKAAGELAITDKQEWLAVVDTQLADMSWNKTVSDMLSLMSEAMVEKMPFILSTPTAAAYAKSI